MIPDPSDTYFLKDIDKSPEFFETIRSHEDDHQRAVYAYDLVRCHGRSSDLAKKTQEDIQELVFLMDNQEYVERDNYGNCSFTRSFDMQQKLEELLHGFSSSSKSVRGREQCYPHRQRNLEAK